MHFYALILLLLTTHTYASLPITTVTHSHGDITTYQPDLNIVYEVKLLDLALTKTIDEFGPFKLVGAKQSGMTHLRATEIIRSQKVENYVKVLGYNEQYLVEKSMDFVRVPIYFGLLSYRTCFTAEKNIPKLKSTNTIKELLKMSQGMGIGWSDSEILKASGVKIIEVANINALYKMLAIGRIDLFCRGTNEVLVEYEDNKHIKGISYDRSIALHYPNPHFFHTNIENQALIQRLTLGIERAYEDGSMKLLWNEVFKESISFVDLKSRRIFEFNNHRLKGLTLNYKKYEFFNSQ